ncbi:STAS domain-containing protein [Roseovarius aestuarii]|uniref:Anti-sigma factor antagonist n=1 Tax=Roseovarius aestuarii TaxID=475083 RepID=A0A1X7BVM6_9RHOB|nr:STAS domain-containing protein [Roseovarius aestuarii]SMC13530.1 Anti-sigma-B factor antagonist [Roseovarius aestuarii]
MDLEVTTNETFDIVTVNAGRIDASVAIQFKDAMRAATENGSCHIILDLGQVNFVDSSGLGAIVAAMKQLGSDRKLDLAALRPDVAKVFHLTRMDTVFDIHPEIPRTDTRSAG